MKTETTIKTTKIKNVEYIEFLLNTITNDNIADSKFDTLQNNEVLVGELVKGKFIYSKMENE